ncbi:DUF4065 domain-containing protein [Lactobacillus salsicarnum]|nr:DUF4065 domain-containing protein [Companilactobacillus mishanensis]
MIILKTKVKNIKQTFKVRDESITVFSDAEVDTSSGKPISNVELDSIAINKAFTEYKLKNGLVTSTEIVSFRKKYHLSQRSLAKLLGIGSATVARYERGSLPTESLSNLLQQLINDDKSFENFFERNKAKLTVKECDDIRRMLTKSKARNSLIIDAYLTRNKKVEQTVYSGFTNFNLDKFENMVVLFSQRDKNLSKTKLNKLLFYADFYNFQKTSNSLTGASYKHDHFGPVPTDFELLYTQLSDDGVIDMVPFENMHGEKIISKKEFNSDNFTSSEIQILNEVLKKFSKFNAKEISQYSHQESAFKETKLKENISYEFAFKLK